MVRLLSPAEFQSRYGSDKIGPDALEITAAELRDRLKKSGRADQGRPARSESTGRHREHLRFGDAAPRRHPSGHALQPADAAAMDELHAAMGKVLREAFRRQGSTLADNVYAAPDGRPGKYAFRVYQRHGHPCPRCRRANIQRIVQAQRSTFFCPACQAAGVRGKSASS